MEQEKQYILKYIKQMYKKDKLKGVVIGLDGGIDSSVVAALFTEALGKENVLGVVIPNNTNKDSIQKLSNNYGFKLIDIDFLNITETFKNEIVKQEEFPEKLENNDKTFNQKIIYSTLRYLATLYSQIKNGKYIVAGTLNKCETFVNETSNENKTEINIIENLTPKDVLELSKYLEIPKEILQDKIRIIEREKELGVSYRDIEQYIKDDKQLDVKTRNKIKLLNDKSKSTIHTYSYEKNLYSEKRSYSYKTISNASAYDWPPEDEIRYFSSEKAARLDALMENWNSPYKLYVPIVDEETGNYEYSKPIYLETARTVRCLISNNDKAGFEKLMEGFDKEEIEKICINAFNYGSSYKVIKEYNKWVIYIYMTNETVIHESYSEIFDACCEAKNLLHQLYEKERKLKLNK